MKEEFGNHKSKRIRLRPAHTIICGFVGVILVGAFLLCLPISSSAREWTNFTDALFTAVSAVCVTGYTVVPVAVHYSGFGQAVLLLLIQTGGLGFMTVTTLIMLIIRKRISYKSRLAISDSLSSDTPKGVIKLVIKILITTGIIEGAGFILLMPALCRDNGAIGIWQSLFLSVSAFCNAGFDLFAGTPGMPYISLINYKSDVLVTLTVAFLIILGGLGFTVIADIINSKFNFKKLSLHSKIALCVTCGLIIVGTLCFLWLEYTNPLTIGNDGGGVKLMASFFQSVTARTAGFSSIDQGAMRTPSKLLNDILMFIGASPCSTGGGIKTTTLAVIALAVISVFKGRENVTVGRHTVSRRNVAKAAALATLGLLVVILLTFTLLLTEQNNAQLIESGLFTFENVLHDAFSAFATTGLTTGIVPYLSVGGKYAVMIAMLFGRVGLMNFGLLFFTGREPEIIKYPEGNITIG